MGLSWITQVHELSKGCKEGAKHAVEIGRNGDSFVQRFYLIGLSTTSWGRVESISVITLSLLSVIR